jgi:hypothetical protein
VELDRSIDVTWSEGETEAPSSETNQAFKLTDDDVTQFIEMWRSEFRETLTTDQARFEAERLLEFFVLLAQELCRSSKRIEFPYDSIGP